jgi:hypothetical protein
MTSRAAAVTPIASYAMRLEVAQKLTRRLSFNTVRKRSEVLEIGGNNHLRARLYGRGNHVAVFCVVLHRRDERLMASHHRFWEVVFHRRAEASRLWSWHRARRYEIALHLVEDFSAPAKLEVTCRRGAQDRVAQCEREQHVRVCDNDKWGGKHIDEPRAYFNSSR